MTTSLPADQEAMAHRVYWWCIAGFEVDPPFSPAERFAPADLEPSVRACFPEADVAEVAFVVLTRATFIAEGHFAMNRRTSAHRNWMQRKKPELLAELRSRGVTVDGFDVKAELVRRLVELEAPLPAPWAKYLAARRAVTP